MQHFNHSIFHCTRNFWHHRIQLSVSASAAAAVNFRAKAHNRQRMCPQQQSISEIMRTTDTLRRQPSAPGFFPVDCSAFETTIVPSAFSIGVLLFSYCQSHHKSCFIGSLLSYRISVEFLALDLSAFAELISLPSTFLLPLNGIQCGPCTLASQTCSLSIWHLYSSITLGHTVFSELLNPASPRYSQGLFVGGQRHLALSIEYFVLQQISRLSYLPLMLLFSAEWNSVRSSASLHCSQWANTQIRLLAWRSRQPPLDFVSSFPVPAAALSSSHNNILSVDHSALRISPIDAFSDIKFGSVFSALVANYWTPTRRHVTIDFFAPRLLAWRSFGWAAPLHLWPLRRRLLYQSYHVQFSFDRPDTTFSVPLWLQYFRLLLLFHPSTFALYTLIVAFDSRHSDSLRWYHRNFSSVFSAFEHSLSKSMRASAETLAGAAISVTPFSCQKLTSTPNFVQCCSSSH